jgi:hypothetical protein
MRDPDELGERQVEGRERVRLSNAKVHREGRGWNHESVKAGAGNGVLAI